MPIGVRLEESAPLPPELVDQRLQEFPAPPGDFGRKLAVAKTGARESQVPVE